MNKFFNFLGLTKRSGKLIEGYSKCNDGKFKNTIKLFIISPDASETTRGKFINRCKENNIPYIEDFSKKELGDALGRLEVMILGISDESMAKKLISLYEEENQCMN